MLTETGIHRTPSFLPPKPTWGWCTACGDTVDLTGQFRHDCRAPYTRWPFFGPKLNRLEQVLREEGITVPEDITPAAFANIVCDRAGPIDQNLSVEVFADIALHRIAQ